MGEAAACRCCMKTLLDGGYLHGDCMTVTGKTHRREPRRREVQRDDQEVIRPVSNPLSPTGGVVGLWGSLAPDGAIVKVAGLKHLQHRGPARVFDCEEACFAAVEDARLQGRRRPGHPLRGPQGRPRHARDAVDHRGALRPGPRRQGRADHRRPLLRRHARLLHRPRRAGGGGGGPIALVKDGDIISIDAENGTLDLEVSEAELASVRRPGRRRRIPIRAAPCGNMRIRSGRRARAR